MSTGRHRSRLSMVKPWAIWCFVIVDAAIFGYLYINLMLAYVWSAGTGREP